MYHKRTEYNWMYSRSLWYFRSTASLKWPIQYRTVQKCSNFENFSMVPWDIFNLVPNQAFAGRRRPRRPGVRYSLSPSRDRPLLPSKKEMTKTRITVTTNRARTRGSKFQDGEHIDVLRSPVPNYQNLNLVLKSRCQLGMRCQRLSHWGDTWWWLS